MLAGLLVCNIIRSTDDYEQRLTLHKGHFTEESRLECLLATTFVQCTMQL